MTLSARLPNSDRAGSAGPTLSKALHRLQVRSSPVAAFVGVKCALRRSNSVVFPMQQTGSLHCVVVLDVTRAGAKFLPAPLRSEKYCRVVSLARNGAAERIAVQHLGLRLLLGFCFYRFLGGYSALDLLRAFGGDDGWWYSRKPRRTARQMTVYIIQS